MKGRRDKAKAEARTHKQEQMRQPLSNEMLVAGWMSLVNEGCLDGGGMGLEGLASRDGCDEGTPRERKGSKEAGAAGHNQQPGLGWQ